jgi:uncharacterized repeat protein (TIGR03943 family)
VRRPAQAILLLLAGLGLLHASLWTDLCLRYVKEGMRPLLVASGALLLLLGAAEAWSSLRRRTPEERDGQDHGDEHGHGHGHGHDHAGVPRVAWLLLLPVLSLLLYAPPALGSYTASRAAPETVSRQEHFDPLPSTSPLPLTLTDFTRRVQQDRGQAIRGRTVRMTGFVTPVRRGGGAGWYLTRIVISCCAADARSVRVRVYGAAAPPADTWVTVTGTWHPGGRLGTSSAPVAVDAHSVVRAPRPVNAYTDALPLPTTR